MPLSWVSLVIALEARSAARVDARLPTAALASPRPAECRGSAGSTDGLWARARAGDVERFCDLLARGNARLLQTPADALLAAEAAEAIAGPLPRVCVLNGRAKLRLGHADAALEQFIKAESGDAQAFLDPKALHDYARAASIAGRALEAVRLYRLLVSRAALLDDARERTVLQIEAAAHVLAYVPNGADEALGYLAQARRAALGLSPWIEGIRQLLAARMGRGEHGTLGSRAPSIASLIQPLAAGRDESPLLPRGELEALSALLTETSDRAASAQYAERFLARAAPENVWLALAQKRRLEPARVKGKAR